MPLFMVLSGAVYYYCIFDLNKYKDKRCFIKSKFKRILIPYFIFGFFCVAPIMILFNFSSLSYIEYICRGIIIPLQSRHLWFLYYLFLYYIYTYFILKNTNKLKIILLNIVLMYIIYLLNIPLISDISYYLIFFNIGNIYNLYFNYFSNKISLFYIISFVITYVLLFRYFNEIIFFRPFIGLFGSLTFIQLITKCILKKTYIKDSKLFSFFKKNSMGIYLFHPMIIYIIYYYFNTHIRYQCLLVFFTYLVCILLSILLTYFVRILKIEFILGE